MKSVYYTSIHYANCNKKQAFLANNFIEYFEVTNTVLVYTVALWFV
jgi:hypothetical protein